MGQKMVCFGGLRGARSRQDESKEVHEVGSKRPSSGWQWGTCPLVDWADLRLVAWPIKNRLCLRLRLFRCEYPCRDTTEVLVVVLRKGVKSTMSNVRAERARPCSAARPVSISRTGLCQQAAGEGKARRVGAGPFAFA
jgi:hypothetical protein